MAGSDFTSGGGGGGFLARVAKLVKPSGQATSWNDLDLKAASSMGADQDVAYSKAAMKDMMERKRHNDFVRKREFEMLRKIRRRERGLEGETSMRPSFFVSSMNYSRPASEREQTLKKIDEIEEQMSKQWWQTKHGNSTQGAPLVSGAGALPNRPSASQAAALQKSPAYSKTEPVSLEQAKHQTTAAQLPSGAAAGTVAPVAVEGGLQGRTHSSPLEIRSSTEAVSLIFPPGTPPAESPAHAWTDQGISSFSPAKDYALEVEEVVHDPELEEAAILFANGDDAAAEASLVDAVSAAGPRQTHEPTWLTLFDYYRATGNQAKFDEMSMDFAGRFDRSAPQWFSLPEMLGIQTSAATAAPAIQKAYDWRAPVVMGPQTIPTMLAILAKAPQPWRIDWGQLRTIEDAAVPLLQKTASEWVGSPVELHFMGVDNLDKALMQGTTAGDSTDSQERWNLRLLMMRLMQRDDDFEGLALEFCVAFEVSPPAWERTQNKYKCLDEREDEQDVMVGHTIIDSMLMDDAGRADFGHSRMMAGVELAGQIHGDASAVLAQLEARRQGHGILVVECGKLMRIDFSAAGNILNWVIEKKSDGVEVHFSNVHRLVAALFNALGISEQARVSVRSN